MADARADPKWGKYAPVQPKPWTPAEVAKSDAVLAWCTKTFSDDALAMEFLSRAATYRYLVTYDWNVQKTCDILKEVMVWRRSHIWPEGTPTSTTDGAAPDWTPRQCPVCVSDPYSAGNLHCIACPALDRFGRAVIYFNLSRLKDVTPKAVIQHLAAVNEAVFDPGDGGQMLFIMDARNFSLSGSGLGKDIAIEFISVSACARESETPCSP